jgi:hypothetical protein
VPTVSLRRTPHRDHLVVCGDDALAARTIEELTTRYGEFVTVILPSRQRNYGPRIARLPGVRVIEREELTTDAYRDAHVQTARALGEPAPSHIRLAGRTLFVTRSSDVAAGAVVCGLAETAARRAPRRTDPIPDRPAGPARPENCQNLR